MPGSALLQYFRSGSPYPHGRYLGLTQFPAQSKPNIGTPKSRWNACETPSKDAIGSLSPDVSAAPSDTRSRRR